MAAVAQIVNTDWLAEHLEDADLRLLDCRFYFDDLERGRRSYLEAHIPGAVYLDWTRDISEPRDHLQYMAPAAGHFAATMQRLGIGDQTTIVAYDDEGGHYVSRLWLILRRFGHDGQLRMLEGGWTKWRNEARPTRAGAEPTPPPTTFSITQEHPEVLVDADEVLRRRDDPNTILLDVRRWSEFTGDEVRAKHGGRIPWASWLLWQDNLNWDANRDFRPIEKIRERYTAAGVSPDKHIITYCHGAVRAAHTAFALSRLGYDNVQVYDGSWEEWGSRDDLPIAQGEP